MMVAITGTSSLEQLLRPLRRELNAELAAALLRMKADDELQVRYVTWQNGIQKARWVRTSKSSWHRSFKQTR
jgi:hypothetical protein